MTNVVPAPRNFHFKSGRASTRRMGRPGCPDCPGYFRQFRMRKTSPNDSWVPPMSTAYDNHRHEPNALHRANGECELDVRHLHRAGHLTRTDDVAWHWQGGSAARLHCGPDVVTVNYYFLRRGQPMRTVYQDVAIVRTRCNFGSTRPWFACPSCKRRCAILLLVHVALCLNCAAIPYPSGVLASIERDIRRQRTIERYLAAGQDEPSWTKPKGKHAAKFTRFVDEYFTLEDSITRSCTSK